MQEKRGPYQKLSDETRAKIGKYASENGDSAASQHFSTVVSKPISRTIHCYCAPFDVVSTSFSFVIAFMLNTLFDRIIMFGLGVTGNLLLGNAVAATIFPRKLLLLRSTLQLGNFVAVRKYGCTATNVPW